MNTMIDVIAQALHLKPRLTPLAGSKGQTRVTVTPAQAPPVRLITWYGVGHRIGSKGVVPMGLEFDASLKFGSCNEGDPVGFPRPTDSSCADLDWWPDGLRLNGLSLKILFTDEIEPGDRHPKVPFLKSADLIPVSRDDKVWFWGGIAAKPDLVYRYRSSLLAIEYKSRANSKHPLDWDNWKQLVRPEDVLQVLTSALVVAQSERRYTAALLSYDNAIVLVQPTPALLKQLIECRDLARQVNRTADVDWIASSTLAKVAAMRLGQTLWPRRNMEGIRKHHGYVQTA